VVTVVSTGVIGGFDWRYQWFRLALSVVSTGVIGGFDKLNHRALSITDSPPPHSLPELVEGSVAPSTPPSTSPKHIIFVL
jgi:hypothetical protein